MACPRPRAPVAGLLDEGWIRLRSLARRRPFQVAYSGVLPDEKGATCEGFLIRAIDYCAGNGITRIERLMTDNAWAYRWSLRAVCAEHGIRQKVIKPHCPWQNGKVGRTARSND